MSSDLASWCDALETPKKRVPNPRRVGKARKGAPVERTVQREIVKGLRGLGFRVIAVPNGVKYAGTVTDRIRQAAVMRADGLVPGFCDLILIRRGDETRPAEVGFVEVKREGGVLSEDQVRCHSIMRADGCRVATVCTMDEALATVRGWGWLA